MAPPLTLTLSEDEARLLLDMAQRYADGFEFNPDPEAQKTAYASWTLAGRIAELVEPTA